MLRSRRANTHLLVRFNTWTSQKLLNWNPIPKLTIVLIWKTPACLKFDKTSNRAVEKTANDANLHMFLFALFVAQCTLVKCNELWLKGWLNAMHCGKKWWIREFVAPYIFPLNPDYVAARSLRSLRSNYWHAGDQNLSHAYQKTVIPPVIFSINITALFSHKICQEQNRITAFGVR